MCYVTGVGVCRVAGKMSGQPWELDLISRAEIRSVGGTTENK